MKIFGPVASRGGVFAGGVPGGKNVMGEIFDVGCHPSIIVKGELKVLPRFRLLVPGLVVRMVAGPGGALRPWAVGAAAWALGARAGGALGRVTQSGMGRGPVGERQR